MPTRGRLLPRSLLVALRDAGVDVEGAAAHAGLTPKSLEAPVLAAQADRFLAVVASRLAPSFGLDVGAELQPELLGVVGLVMASSSTYGDALQRLSRYKAILSDDSVTITARGCEVVLNVDIADSQSSFARQLIDCELAFIVAFGRRMTRAPIRPIRIGIALPKPDYHARYGEVFGCPVAFTQPATELVLRAADLERPLVGAREDVHALLTERAEGLLAETSDELELTTRVRRIVRAGLRGEVPDVAFVAGRLGMSARSLQRQLQNDGASFKELVAEARLALARRYLQGSDLPIAEVSYLLGFSHPNAFFRAFKRWTRTTPEQFRRRRRDVTPPTNPRAEGPPSGSVPPRAARLHAPGSRTRS